MRTAQMIAAVAWIAGFGWAADTHPVATHQREAPAKAASAKAAGKPAMPAMSDAQMEAAIRAKFAKSKINAEKFTVHVQGGVATIEGRTNVVQHKGVATRMARTAGAVAVSNHIKVSDA